ncbi:hypothetical protein D7X74_09970 [Corallococcus sp. CA047B]|uniref:hypothetical protein n=1 Tax=Corallococcus sp. CA047B TaxID=2316729 RepID=UPI000EA1BCC7|nr:hypothetical protein [Corallococcus sp. CA047B]RKH18306.1 hypothetical protein D7X74_09970 [Corallococcus sp. CA047B]
MAWDSTKSAPSAQQPEPSTQCPIPGGYRRAVTRHHPIHHPDLLRTARRNQTPSRAILHAIRRTNTDFQRQTATAVWKERRRLDIRTAREEVSPAAIDTFVQHLIASQAVVVGLMRDRTLVDNLQETRPLALRFGLNGRIEKLELLLLAKHSACRA